MNRRAHYLRPQASNPKGVVILCERFRRFNMAGHRLTVIVAVLMVVNVHAYGGGAPEGACDSLTPNHNAPPQNGPAPYTITVSKTTVGPGEQVDVTLSGTNPFKGFFLRARQNNAFVDGTFQANNFGQSRCNGQGVTHNNPSPKNNVNIAWIAPASLGPSPVTFVATFVQEKIMFWTEVTSPAVSVSSAGSTNNNPMPPTSNINNNPMPPTSNTNSNPMPPTSNINTFNPGTTTITSRVNNGVSGQQNPGVVALDPECSKSKGCFHDCDSNGGACTYLVTWVQETGSVFFQFLYKTPSSSDKWIGLGLSRDVLMGDDSVMECVMQNGQVQVKTSFNNGKMNDNLDDNSAGLSDFGGSVVNGVLACNFRRKVEYPADPRVFDLKQDYHLMVATGEAVSGNKFPHSYEQLPKVSANKMSLLRVGSAAGGLDSVYPFVKSHGIFMTLAWMFFASSGLFTARHGRSMFHNSKPFGMLVWFHIHRFFMAMTTILTTVGFIMILVESRGYSFIPDSPGKTYRLVHPPLGLILIIITLLNPLMAIFRPDLKSPSRSKFNWAHWGCGMFAWLLSLLMMVIGLDLNKSQADVRAIYVLFAFIGYQLIMEVIIRVVPSVLKPCDGCTIQGCCKSTKSYSLDMTEVRGNGFPSNEENSLPPIKEEGSTEDDNNEKIQRRENIITSSIIIVQMVVSAAFTIAVLVFFLRQKSPN